MKDRLALSGIGIISALVVCGVGVLLSGRRSELPGYDVSALPAVNASLNGASAILLSAGYVCIRKKKILAHKICMVAAFSVSMLFLISYVIYHYHAGSIPFQGTGMLRAIYFPLLISHIVLAAVLVPLALLTLYRAWGGWFEQHKRIARWTLPLWVYVSVTGVIVYWMLYQLSPP
jgi:putative membrane protein